MRVWAACAHQLLGGACLQVAWAGNHTLASASEKDNVVRMYNFDTEDNYVLNLEQDSGLVSKVVALAYDERWGRGGGGRRGRGGGGQLKTDRMG